MQKRYKIELTLTTEANAPIHALRRVEKAIREYSNGDSRRKMEVSESSCVTISPPKPQVGLGARFVNVSGGGEYILALTGKMGGGPVFALIGLSHGESWDHKSMPLRERFKDMLDDAHSEWTLKSTGSQAEYPGTVEWKGEVAL